MTTSAIAVIILVGVFLVLMLLRVPIGFAMGCSTVATMLFLNIPIEMVFQGMISGTNVFTFMAVPFFIFAGDLMSDGGISNRLIVLANSLVGWLHGGAAMVNVMGSMFFGGISGSATADAASLGPIEIKMMTGQGYEKDFSTALTMASSVQGMLIPPSHNMVMYAVTAGSVSIGSLFMGGLVPGITLGVALMIYSYFVAKKRHYPVSERFRLGPTLRAMYDAMWGLMTIVIIVVGVSGGVMTATESASIAVLWAFIVSTFIYKGIRLRDYFRIAKRSIHTLSMIMILIAASYSFGWIMAYLQIPAMITKALLAISGNKIVLLFIINIMLLILGMTMSMSSIILIITPILVPVLQALDVNLVHFGVVMILNLGMGLITPPVGGVLYVGTAISGLKMGQLTKAMMPFFGVMFVVLMLITYIPEITLWLPGLMGY